MKNSLINYYHSHPFRSLLIVGLFFRIIAAIFSEGFAFQDDHFLVIEKAQHWVDGIKNAAQELAAKTQTKIEDAIQKIVNYLIPADA